MKKIIVTLFSVMMIFLSSCGSTAEVSEAAPTTEKSSSVKETKSDKNLYKGAGLVIAVTAPEVRNGGKAESWMPQFFQDSITGNLAKYSKMTVLDRANEDLTKAEQELGETGFYTEENAVQLGQMTNAQYAVFGSITALSSSYELNFRAIDITTNEIKAAYNDRAGSKEIEDGTSVRAIITELLDGLGIGLSEKEKAQLAKTDKKSLNATKSLAKGAAAEKADNLIEALAFYAEAQENGATKKEASVGINSILGTNGTVSGNAIANLKAQLTWEKEQEEKWNKIFRDFQNYMKTNSFILVYDFSKVEVTPNSYGTAVNFNISPGIKAVPIRKTLIVAKEIYTEWNIIKNKPENKNWVSKVSTKGFYTKGSNFIYELPSRACLIRFGAFSDSDFCINEIESTTDTPSIYSYISNSIHKDRGKINVSNINSQKNYFKEAVYESKYMKDVGINALPDDSDIHFKITKAEDVNRTAEISFMSIEEYNEWAKDQ